MHRGCRHALLQNVPCCLMVVCGVGQPYVAVMGQSGNTVMLDVGGHRCEIVWLDTLVELVYDGVEGSMYVMGAWTAMVSRMLSLDFK